MWILCGIVIAFCLSAAMGPFALYPALAVLSHLQFSRSEYLVPFAVLPPWVFCPMCGSPLWVSCPICSLFRSGYLVPFAVYPALGIWFHLQFTLCVWSCCKLILVYLVPPKMYPSLGILTHWELIPWQKFDHYSQKEIRDSQSYSPWADSWHDTHGMSTELVRAMRTFPVAVGSFTAQATSAFHLIRIN